MVSRYNTQRFVISNDHHEGRKMKKDHQEAVKAATSHGGIDYKKTAFFLIDKDGKQHSVHQLKNKRDHDDLIAKARAKSCYVYYGSVYKDEYTKAFMVRMPLIVDFDSVPDTVDGKWKAEDKKNTTNYFKCPYCDYEATSTPGRTLHVKSKHKEKFDEYKNGDTGVSPENNSDDN
mgnify:FL=1